MNESPKLSIVEGFLDFVERFVPLREAYLATLGGWGLEARVWRERGILPERAWLIESQKAFSRQLISRFPFRYCSSLKQFPRAFRAVRAGSSHGVDGFHLDLCGTYERSDTFFNPSLPLIKESRGRCFAVTVADQRRNTSLENFDEITSACRTHFGASADALFAHLLATQQELARRQEDSSFDPEKGARRELGLVLRLWTAFSRHGLSPDLMERYVYVSYRQNQPFRMRTYFFRLGTSYAQERVLLRVWSESPVYLMSRGERLLVTCALQKETMPVIKNAASGLKGQHSYAKLSTLCHAAGEEFVAALQSLEADAELGRRVREAFADYGVTAAGVPAAVAPATGTVFDHVPDKRMLAQLKLLVARSEGPQSFEVARMQFASDREVAGVAKKGKFRAVGALYAHTQGKHRPAFIKRAIGAVNGQGEELLKELARIYSRIEGVEITPEMLRTEACLGTEHST